MKQDQMRLEVNKKSQFCPLHEGVRLCKQSSSVIKNMQMTNKLYECACVKLAERI